MHYYVLDTETTGVSVTADRVIELAAGLYDDASGVPSQICYLLANPGVPIPDGASRVHGYYDRDVANCPPLADGLPRLAAFLTSCENAPVYVHNVEFDREILRHEFARAGLTLPDVTWICTLELARAVWPQHENHLAAVAERVLSESIDATALHRASGDVDLLARCVPDLLQRFAHRGSRTGLARPAPTPMAVQGTGDLETQAAAVVQAASERVGKVEAWALAFACESDEDEAHGHEGIARIKTFKADADKGRKAIVDGIDKTKRSIDAAFREGVVKPLDAAIARVEGQITPFVADRMRRHREAEIAAANALREAEAKAAVEIAARGAVAAETVAAVQDAVAEVVQAQAPVVPIRTTTATAGYDVRRIATIIAPSSVPREYWRPDAAAVQAAVDAGATLIPGVEIREEIIVKNRRRA